VLGGVRLGFGGGGGGVIGEICGGWGDREDR